MKYRITHPDPHNWCIEEFQEGGSTISRGKFAGQEMQAKWKAPTAFYRTLEDAAKALLDKAAGDALLTGETTNVLEALKLAEARVQEALAHPPEIDLEGMHLCPTCGWKLPQESA